MAWNEPGKGGNSGNSGSGGNGGGPPDLDQIWKRLRDRLGKRGNQRPNPPSGQNGQNGGPGRRGGAGLFWIIIPIVIVIWLATGLYIVNPGEKGVILRPGKYVYTVDPGWHWRVPQPATQARVVDTRQTLGA